jgi:putative ABC transport system substrate-binding protein
MKRREFIALLAGTAVARRRAAHAQQPTMPVIGFLAARSLASDRPLVSAFRRGLTESGYVEGRNVAIEYGWAEGHLDRLPALAADLVHRPVAVIVASSAAAALAAKAATAATPIVFAIGVDPVKLELVASISRPGGNVTSVSFFTAELGSKRLGLLRELVPNATAIAMLFNPNFPDFESQLTDFQESARALQLQSIVLSASTEEEIDKAFATLIQNESMRCLSVPILFSSGSAPLLRRSQRVAPFRPSIQYASTQPQADL